MKSPPITPAAWNDLLSPQAWAPTSARHSPSSSAAPAPVSPTPQATPWTHEQQLVLNSSASHGCLTALAGSGKTYGILEYMRRRPRTSWRYVVYNKEMELAVRDLRPANVRVSTLHATAFPQFGIPLASKLDEGHGRAAQVLVPHSQSRSPWASTYERVLRSALRRFIQSDAPAVAGFAASPSERAEMTLASRNRLDWSSWDKDLEALWSASIDHGHPQACEHDVYVKLMQLSDAVIREEGLVLDEAQDVTPCMHAWWSRQDVDFRWRAGDPYQAIYGWRGAILPPWPMPNETSFSWSISQRCPPVVCTLASRVLALLHAPHILLPAHPQGPAGIITTSSTGSFDAHLARTRQGVVERVLSLRETGVAAEGRDQGLWIRLGQLSHAVAHGVPLAGTAARPGSSEWEVWVEENPEAGWAMAWRLYCKWGQAWTTRHSLWQKDVPGPRVRVMTIHEAKGATFDSVALLPDIPGQSTTDVEELRLLYVAITRARQQLGLPEGWACPG